MAKSKTRIFFSDVKETRQNSWATQGCIPWVQHRASNRGYNTCTPYVGAKQGRKTREDVTQGVTQRQTQGRNAGAKHRDVTQGQNTGT